MEQKDLIYFKNKLLTQKQKILSSDIMTSYDDLKVETDDLADDADLANSTINQQITFNIRHREIIKLKKIDAALARIEDQTYGICLESGEEIERQRLEKQPWAEYCLEVAEEMERQDQHKIKRYAL